MKNLVLFLLASFILSACVTPNYGTGIKFTPAINPEPEKYALVYTYRNDGWGYGGQAKNSLIINAMYENDPDLKVPVGVYQAKQYRPFLFEAPKKVKFGATLSVKQDMDLKPGGTYCIEVGWHFRGLDVVTYNERSLDECMKDLADMELVKSLDEIRRNNGAVPLKQIGFRELIPAPPVATQLSTTPVQQK